MRSNQIQFVCAMESTVSPRNFELEDFYWELRAELFCLIVGQIGKQGRFWNLKFQIVLDPYNFL